jgi:hypothetical protein
MYNKYKGKDTTYFRDLFSIFLTFLFLKTVAFIAGKSENQAAKFFFIPFSIDNLIANISFYALSWPKLNFGCYLTFEIIFKALKPENSAFFM